MAVRPHNAIYNPTGEILAGLPITVDPEMAERTWGTTARLAETHRLTARDAAYLELAQRMGLPLATQGVELIAAARATGVGLAGGSEGDALNLSRNWPRLRG